MPDHFCIVSDHAGLKPTCTCIMSVQQQDSYVHTYNGQFTVVTNYDIIGENFGTTSTLPRTELTQRQLLSQWKSLSYKDLVKSS